MSLALLKSATYRTGPTGTIRVSPTGEYRGKRLLDLGVVLLALPLLLPLIAVLAALVALDGSKPFFLQRRVGRNGRVFSMVKLRTMVPNAEARLAQHLETDAAARQEWERFQKLARDPRVTVIGRLLRRTSLDELPQIFNVLVGDMSLVGPRPMLPEQATLYPGKAYFLMRPGITGPWQVSDRNCVSFADRAVFDLHYIATQSLKADLGYLFRTFGAVIRMSGR